MLVDGCMSPISVFVHFPSAFADLGLGLLIFCVLVLFVCLRDGWLTVFMHPSGFCLVLSVVSATHSLSPCMNLSSPCYLIIVKSFPMFVSASVCFCAFVVPVSLRCPFFSDCVRGKEEGEEDCV